MKITKAMGRACLGELESGKISHLASKAMIEMFGSADEMCEANDVKQHLQTALAMCAAIAGVRPEDVE